MQRMLIIENHLLSSHCLIETYRISVASEITWLYQIMVHNYSQILLELIWTSRVQLIYHLFVIYYQKIFTMSKDIVTLNLFVTSAWCADEKVNKSRYYLIESSLQDFVFVYWKNVDKGFIWNLTWYCLLPTSYHIVYFWRWSFRYSSGHMIELKLHHLSHWRTQNLQMLWLVCYFVNYLKIVRMVHVEDSLWIMLHSMICDFTTGKWNNRDMRLIDW